MFKNLLFGKPGLRRHELHPIHRLTRYLYTRANVALHGHMSWREYKRTWMR